MNIILINPYMPIEDHLTILHPPLGFGYISTALKKYGHNSDFIDLPWVKSTERLNKINDCLSQYTRGLVGITCVTQTYAIALSLAKYIKDRFPAFFVVLGGPHVTFIAEETLTRFQFVDFISLYEGEHTISLLANALGINDASLSSIPGLAFRDSSGKIVVTVPEPPVKDIDNFRWPDRSLFDIPRYLKNDYETVIMTARGCPNRCTFCSTSVMGRTYRTHSIEHVISEIESVLEMGFKSVFFGDDTFPANRDRITKLCDVIIQRGIKFDWTCNMRVMDVESKLIEKMNRAGMYRTFIGYESFNPITLAQMRKEILPTMQIEAARILRNSGVELHSSMIIGCSTDTRESVLQNVQFLKHVIRPTLATFNTIELRPGTNMYKNPEKYGYFLDNPYWYEDIHCIDKIHVRTKYLTEKEIRLLCGECYEQFYS